MHSPGVPVMKMTGTGPNRFWISLTADGPVPVNSLTSDVMTLGGWEIAADGHRHGGATRRPTTIGDNVLATIRTGCVCRLVDYYGRIRKVSECRNLGVIEVGR